MRALWRFAACGLTVAAWLVAPAEQLTPEALEAEARSLVTMADEDWLEGRPRRRKAAPAIRECREQVEDLELRFDALDDPALKDDENVKAFVAFAGVPLRNAIEVEVIAHALYRALAAVTDLTRGEVVTLLEVAPAPLGSAQPAPSQTRFAPLEQYLSLLLLGDFDWHAAERVADAADEQQRADLCELRRVVEDREYRRFCTSTQVGNHDLFIAAPHGHEGDDVALGIGRLARDGILDAGGAIGWQVPDLDFTGPVESYVRGYGPRDG